MPKTISTPFMARSGPVNCPWNGPGPQTGAASGDFPGTSRFTDAVEFSDPPTIPPESPPNPVTPEPPAHPIEPPPSENPVPVREPSEVKPPVALL